MAGTAADRAWLLAPRPGFWPISPRVRANPDECNGTQSESIARSLQSGEKAKMISRATERSAGGASSLLPDVSRGGPRSAPGAELAEELGFVGRGQRRARAFPARRGGCRLHPFPDPWHGPQSVRDHLGSPRGREMRLAGGAPRETGSQKRPDPINWAHHGRISCQQGKR